MSVWERRFMPVNWHPCGCETKWDLIDWRSIAVRRCAEHAAAEASNNGSST